MPNLGPAELIVILIVALVVFGPRKLPELGKSLGAGLREFRRSTQGLREELEGSMKSAPPAPGPAPVQTSHASEVVGAAHPQAAQTPSPVAAQALTPQAGTPVGSAQVAFAPRTVDLQKDEAKSTAG